MFSRGCFNDGWCAAEINQLHLAWSLAVDLFAEVGVDMHAGEARLLVALGGRFAGFVVTHDELTICIALEPVDDAAQCDARTAFYRELMFDMKFKSDGFDGGGIFDVEVFVHEYIGIAEEGHLFVGVEREFCPLGIGIEFV